MTRPNPIPEHRLRAVLATLAVLALALLPVLASTPAAATADRTTWALEPANADGADGRVSYRHTVEPGSEITEHVALTNYSAHPVTFQVYAGDGQLTADGQFDLPPTGDAPVAGGSWVALGDPAGGLSAPGTVLLLEVAGGGTVVLPFVVRVPADAVPGDHPAGIVAALASGPDGGVGVDTRVGARLHLRVAGDLVTALAVRELTATYVPSWSPFARGTLRLDYRLANVGDVRLGGAVATRVAGPFGLAASGSEGPDPRELLPGTAVPVTADFPAWPLGRLSGEVTVTPAVVGEDALTGASLLVAAPFEVWAVPWAQLGAVVVIVAVGCAVPRVRRRRAEATQRRVDAAVAAARAAAGGASGN
ncbi:MAG: hypothetical protein ABW025_07245 [Cellulomonas sp.]